ncbi:MAG: hypothetical protein CMM94_07090 [Rickettsiales bacterium]|nr:hypothetical protein [Rickettsiales bacterium]|tara:strand:+ start:536 stop:1084 length:549 start_codon:yes stop_codon:yes gene_type:complete
MKTFAKTLLAAAGAVMLAGAAQAGQLDNNDVVTDERGQVVVNTFGNCVRTKWEGGHSGCYDMSKEARTVYFEFDSAALTPAARAKLDSLVGMIRGRAEVESLNVVGFADRIGSDAYNANLSKRRADSVRRYLNQRGVVKAQATEVRGLGESRSVSNCEGLKGPKLKACLWRDRRVEVELITR